MSTKALAISKNDIVYVKEPIPGSSDKPYLVKKARVVSTVKRGAKVQIEGQRVTRHVLWNSLALHPEDFECEDLRKTQKVAKLEAVPDPLSETVEEPEVKPTPKEMEPGVVEAWMSMGDDIVGEMIRTRDAKKTELEDVLEQQKEMLKWEAQLRSDIDSLGRRINKILEFQKAIKE